MMCGCSSQVAMLDVFAAILDNSFKTSMPFNDTVINETLRVRVFATRWLSLASALPPSLIFVGGILVAEEHPKSTGLISGLFGGHMWGSMKLVLFYQIVHRGPGGVRRRFILLQCPPVMTTYSSDTRQQTLLGDDIAVVWAVNFRSRIDGSMKTTLSSPYETLHDVATEVFPFT